MEPAHRHQPAEPTPVVAEPARHMAPAGYVGRLLGLQASAGNRAVGRMLAARGERRLQRFADGQLVTSKGTIDGRLSNQSYLVPGGIDADAHDIWVGLGATPRWSRLAGGGLRKGKIGLVDYQRHIPERKLIADCLHSAEEINAGAELALYELRSRVAGTHTPFGDTDTKNQAAARAFAGARDEAADAAVGQAFVIIETTPFVRDANGRITIPNPSGYPYHAAAVVAQHGNDRITLEASAGSRHGTVRNTQGIYDVYTVGHEAHSFHARHQADFTAPITIVIEPKPDDPMVH
jgi:hypothetical protein